MATRDIRNHSTERLWQVARSAPLLSADDEARLTREAQAGSQRAFDELLTAHLRLVLTFAHKFTTYGVMLPDLVGEGLLGLVEAARRFDASRGARLATYAAWWIRAYMRRYTLSNRRIVRAPTSRHGNKLMAHLRTTQRELTQLYGEAPDAELVANALGVGVRDVEEMEAALSGRDIPYGVDRDGNAWELPADQSSPEQIYGEVEERQVVRDVIAQAMEQLRDRDRTIVEQRYFVEEGTTLAATGRKLGLSRERVRQLNEKACAHLRSAVLQSHA